MPAVSVIMNCLNGEKYLREAIDSVYAQTYKDWEIIFWDNASTDNSTQIAKSSDGKLRYFKSDYNVPLGKARNWAIEKAQGKYIAFLDCDDIWLPEKLEKQVSLLERHPSIDFIYSNCFAVDVRTNKKWLLLKGKQPVGKVFEYHLANYMINMLTVLVRKSTLDALDMLFDETLHYAEEFDIFLRIFYKSNIDYIDEPLAVYRIHPKMSTLTYGIESIMNETEYVIEKLKCVENDFEKKYSKALSRMKCKIAFFRSRGSLYRFELSSARRHIAPYKFHNIACFILYISSYLPTILWRFIVEARKTIKKLQGIYNKYEYKGISHEVQ